MRTASKHENGIVAILDALGAASYSESEIERFLKSRQVVLEALNDKAEAVLIDIDARAVATFTFNDTILIVLKTGNNQPQLEHMSAFLRIMRKFLVDSMAHGILFRGSIAVGKFYADDDTNTVMGEAVTDAAAWYDKADWIGVHTTPHATLVMQRWLEHSEKTVENKVLDYDVPLKEGAIVRAKAVNWPKVFFFKRIKPWKGKPKEKLLEFFTEHRIPWGVESKFLNTIAFFDHAVAQSGKGKSSKRI
jgi:hypothetical protein